MTKRITFPINILSKIFSLKTKVEQAFFPLTGRDTQRVFLAPTLVNLSHVIYFTSQVQQLEGSLSTVKDY